MEEGDTYLHPRGNGFPSSASARATASEHRRRCGGADPNFRDSDGRTAMHIAACEGQAEVVELLLQRGADAVAEDQWGSTVSLPELCFVLLLLVILLL